MGRLFWKIFGSFWIASVTLVVLGAWATYEIASLSEEAREDRAPGARGAVRAAIRGHRLLHAVTEGLAAGDRAGVAALIERDPGRVFVVDGRGEELLGRPLPPDALRPGAPVPRPPASGPPERWLVQSAAGAGGERYTVIARMTPRLDAEPPPRRPGAGARFLRPLIGPRHWREYWWVRLGVALLVSGAVCYLLARYLTGPVRRLRSATRRAAGGDLSVRVGGSLGGRRDEIADLSRDFDLMAERLDALVTSQQRLLRDIAHELRSPLARLRVALELARQRAPGRAEAEHARIELETERLSELIGEILALEQLNHPIVEERAEAVDLAGVVCEVVEDAAFEGRPSGVEITTRIETEPRVRGQAAQLRSAIENVVRNACRHSPEGATVTVSLEPDRRGATAVVRVRDRGPGVPESALEHLFEPFYRVDDARSRERGGHGLGLAIAERIARRHRGTIEAANVPGGGLEVTFRLPVLPG